jgi:peptidoglycan hydrolase-like protein with peptidoglycan-binding domain
MVAAVVGLFLAATSLPAFAAPEHTLTIEAPNGAVATYGDAVHLAGKLTPGAIGEQVHLRTHNGKILATVKTVQFGKFAFDYVPHSSIWVHAEWDGVRSNSIQVKARPRVTAAISGVLLFGTATVSGTVAPWDRGGRVVVTVLENGARMLRRTVWLSPSSSFRFTVPISRPGSYSVRALYDTPKSLKGQVLSEPEATPLPALERGSKGTTVLLLERRLQQLHYLLMGVNDTYDGVTGDAVMAFRKVQGMTRTWTTDESVWRRLASPVVPHPRDGSGGFHVEIDQTRQVIYTVQDGSITNVLHTSTGKPSTPTRDGTFSVHRKVNGYSIGHLYYPSYFDGNRAVHGWTSVPEYNASHGCARIPYWAATFMYDRMPIGTKVIVYHS